MKRSIILRYSKLLTVSILAFLWIAPVYIVFINAAKTTTEFNSSKFWQLPSDWAIFQNIKAVLIETDLGQAFINSILYGVLGAGIAILVAALAAYALTNLKIKGGFYWFLLIYSGTLFPFQMYLIPLFQFYSDTKLYNTFVGMLIFYIAICIPFCLFVLRNFYSTFAKEIVEAAKLDGCSDLQIFVYMFLPQSVPPFLVLFLLQFTWVWNDLLFGITLSQSDAVRPIMASLSSLNGLYSGTGMNTLLMGALIASIPTLLLFFLLQKYFIKGMAINIK
ncbi:carbohydrate ABC transporter permease [Terrihalobacillus insolitus]|uniref:carbohydrate ABC transporter permease n=1 Tax=Terrihalobacillus insolitus TaxID=2950438 RepID=UPI0023417D97|nr:carbohydrate ABC transporter permease [Terrihalobacillus insolitus]MDC3415146.1 carbohydrate ABC transporter permease [Terrihalobacillus insolitus]